MHCPLPSVKVYTFLIRVNITNIAKIKFYTLATQSQDLMQKGTRLTKVRGKGKKYKRDFKLDEDLLSISYRGSKKWFGGDRDCKGKFSYIRMHLNRLLNAGQENKSKGLKAMRQKFAYQSICANIILSVIAC